MKKFFSYMFIAIILVGLFSPLMSVQASTQNPQEPCVYDSTGKLTNFPCKVTVGTGTTTPPINPGSTDPTGTCTISILGSTKILASTKKSCETPVNAGGLGGTWSPEIPSGTPGTPIKPNTMSAFETEVNNQTCGFAGFGGTVMGCVLQLVYWVFYQLAAFLLWVAAQFFNVLVGITMQGELLKSDFVSSAWGVVRDFSNIFFILILLYAAVQMILDLGEHGTKKIITNVIIMALLINFSMFFTKVVIDTANVLALIFYNKISVVTVDSNGNQAYTNYKPVTGEKDIAGGMVKAFDPTQLLKEDFFNKQYKEINVPGYPNTSEKIPTSILIGITIIAGLLMLFAAYAFFVTGIYFLGRLIELFVLIVFAPFAFMSFAVPKLSGLEYIGWNSWFHKLISVSFMAPIFMFFMYFIFKLIGANMFDKIFVPNSMIETLLRISVPALVILVLLMKATEFAKKGSGQFGEAVAGAAKLGAAVGIGGAALTGAAVLKGSVGAFMKGASTGDTAANRMQGAALRIANHQATLTNPASTIVERTHARKEIMRERTDQVKGSIQRRLRLHDAQQWVGTRLNQDQHNIEHASHARHDLDTAAGVVAHGKKWEELNGEQRVLARTNMERDRERRAQGWGNRTWGQLSPAEQAIINGLVNPRVQTGTTHADQTTIQEARVKQGIASRAIQSGVTGTYDVRNLANVAAREQTSGTTKFLSGATGLLASGMRGGFKQMGINYGKAEGAFLKDLGSTISEALKSVKINLDLSGVGEIKKEDDHGHGGHH